MTFQPSLPVPQAAEVLHRSSDRIQSYFEADLGYAASCLPALHFLMHASKPLYTDILNSARSEFNPHKRFKNIDASAGELPAPIMSSLDPRLALVAATHPVCNNVQGVDEPISDESEDDEESASDVPYSPSMPYM